MCAILHHVFEKKKTVSCPDCRSQEARTITAQLVHNGKRCSNYKISGQWTRVSTLAPGLNACAAKCVEDAAAASVDCNMFAYKDGSCLF